MTAPPCSVASTARRSPWRSPPGCGARGCRSGFPAIGDFIQALAVSPPTDADAAVLDGAGVPRPSAGRTAGLRRGVRRGVRRRRADAGHERATHRRRARAASIDDGTDQVPAATAIGRGRRPAVGHPAHRRAATTGATSTRWCRTCCQAIWPASPTCPSRARARRPGPAAGLAASGGTGLATAPTRRLPSTAGTPHRAAVHAGPLASDGLGTDPARPHPAVDKPRRVVVLCDVSQSMQAQAVAYLHLMRALALTADAEVFAFATRVDQADQRAGAPLGRSGDRAGHREGDRPVRRHPDRDQRASAAGLASRERGARCDRAHRLGRLGQRSTSRRWPRRWPGLRRRAHRIVWLNPRAAAPGFEPPVAAMAAALPYCDALEPVDTVASLATAIANLPDAVNSTASRGSRAGTARR